MRRCFKWLTLAAAHFNKDDRAICRAHDQVNFSTPAPRRPIIALQKSHSAFTQIRQRRVFSGVAELLGGIRVGLDLRNNH